MIQSHILLPAIIRLVLFLIPLLWGCHSNQTLEPEGFIKVTGGKVWYHIEGKGNNTPILLLHGGPGAASYYLKPMKALSKDRPIIFFDQLGCGRSDRITDTTLMTLANYVEELEQVRKFLGLKDFYVYGHSWGTMLATDYYLKYPKGIKAMILSSPCISTARWQKDADTLIATLPEPLQINIRTNEKNKNFNSPEYQKAIVEYANRFMSINKKESAEMENMKKNFGQNVYEHMWGPSEFTITGNLKNYDNTRRLKDIKVPTLFMSGEFDEARSNTVEYYKSLVPGAQIALIKDAAHLTMQDHPRIHNKVVKEFLNSLEKH